MIDDPPDPNAAYAVLPVPEGHWLAGGWMVTRNSEPCRYYAQADRAAADRYATDPAWRAELAARETPLHRQPDR